MANERYTYHIDLARRAEVARESLEVGAVLVREGHPPPLGRREYVGCDRSRGPSSLPGRYRGLALRLSRLFVHRRKGGIQWGGESSWSVAMWVES